MYTSKSDLARLRFHFIFLYTFIFVSFAFCIVSRQSVGGRVFLDKCTHHFAGPLVYLICTSALCCDLLLVFSFGCTRRPPDGSIYMYVPETNTLLPATPYIRKEGRSKRE